MPNREFYEVDVPIHKIPNPALRGLHVFTGEAGSPTTALRRAHEVYDAALAAQQAALEIPGKQPDGWGARGLRHGWEMEWTAAKADGWNNPVSWTRRRTARSASPPHSSPPGSPCARAAAGDPRRPHPAGQGAFLRRDRQARRPAT
ncbi:hypothetical protein [Streptomyces cucumeris]|uniref:hypothetical protein n=1 Tax=Streptomyces cucumeris TaxID=2962890 RepID=UPI003D7278AB